MARKLGADDLRYLYDLKGSGQIAEALNQIGDMREEGYAGADLDVMEADCLARKGDTSLALEILETCEEPLPPYGQAFLGGLLEHDGRESEGLDIFERLAGLPQLAPSVARRVIKAFEKRDPEKALNLARRLPSSADRYLLLARLLRAIGRVEEAREALAEGRKSFPDNQTLAREWVMLGLEGLSPEEKAEELEVVASTAAHAGNPQIKERLAQSYRQDGRLEEARRLFLECLQANPRNIYLKSQLAYVQRDLGNIAAALDLLEEVLDESPGDHYAESAYFATCRVHDRERARGFVASRAAQDPSRRRLWGKIRGWKE